MKKNLFIAFEGIDGSGKSTQLQLLGEKLQHEGHQVYATFEPSDRPIGKMIREILKGGSGMDDRVIAGLFVADRLDHLLNHENGIVKKLEQGYTVLCDRYCFSSYAYQGTHMSMDWVIKANSMSASILKPDLNIFIDVAPEVSMQRINKNRETIEIYETLENLRNVRAKFFEAFEKLNNDENIFIVKGERDKEVVTNEIYQKVDALLRM